MDILPDPTLYSVCLSVGVLTVEELQAGGLQVLVTTVDNRAPHLGQEEHMLQDFLPVKRVLAGLGKPTFFQILHVIVRVC